MSVPVIAVDGPSGSGKGTICQWLAEKLGWHLLDSGAIYRVSAWAALDQAVGLEDTPELINMIESLELAFDSSQPEEGVSVILSGRDISNELRTESCAKAASTIAANPEVRKALLSRQRQFQMAPGLVADGRDMGTIVFPEAPLKIFLTASVDERAKRRHKQLNKKGINANLADLFREIEARDQRDMSRTAAPLKPAQDAHIVDTTGVPIEVVCEQAYDLVKKTGLIPD